MFRAANDPVMPPGRLASAPAGAEERSRDCGTIRLSNWLLATLLAMFPLIWFGGLTTSHGAGLAVPDWPNTYGYNMFAVPFSVWLSESAGGIFFEHTHRLLGSLTGLLAVAATLSAWGVGAAGAARNRFGWMALVLGVLAVGSSALLWIDGGARGRAWGHAASGSGGLFVIALLAWLARRREPRPWMRWSMTALLAAIIAQGVLGGLRVTEVNLELAIVHGVFAQMTFCFAGFLALATSAWWGRVGPAVAPADCPPLHAPRRSDDRLIPRGLLMASAVLTLLVLGQLIVAALMRHYQSGLAVPDFPLSYGQLVPPVSSEGLEHANEVRAFDLALPRTTLAQIWLHTAHRIGALIITVAVAWLVFASRRMPGKTWPARHIWLLCGLLIAQLGLGVATIWMRKPADIATAHVATGAVFFLTSWLLTARLLRLRHLTNSPQAEQHQIAPVEPSRPHPRQSAARSSATPAAFTSARA